MNSLGQPSGPSPNVCVPGVHPSVPLGLAVGRMQWEGSAITPVMI